MCCALNEKEKWETCKNCVFFLSADFGRIETVEINGKTVNKWKGKGVEVPCKITFTGWKQMINKLKEIL